MTPTILDRIVARKKEEIAAAKRITTSKTLEDSEFFGRQPLVLKEFMLDVNRTGIIAEFKRKSPSKGLINGLAQVADVTQAYNAAGASALSVLTDSDFFGGSKEDLIAARRANEIPLLRKDFIIDEYQILEAKAWGADIILLIAAILSPTQINNLAMFAKELQLNVLLEVHNEKELESSICPHLDAIGVNNRNLADFTVNVQNSFRLVGKIPDQFLKISESAISSPQTISSLKTVGFNGFLIGENFMKTNNPGLAMSEFAAALKH